MKVRTKKDNDKKLPLIALLIVACVGISIGFSALSTTLTINGVANVSGMSFKIEFQNLSEATLTGNAQKITDPVISADKTEISSYNVNFLDPGDSISYTFQIANNGTINAKLSQIIRNTISCEGYGNSEQATTDANNVCANLEYTLKYQEAQPHYDDSFVYTSSSTDIEVNDILNSGDVKDMILTLKYKSPTDSETITEPEDDVSISNLGIELIYSQNKVSVTTPDVPDTEDEGSFSTDSWATIAANVKSGNTSNYNVGDTKTVDLGDTYGTHTVRIANMSTPDECATDGFSQTACGFVVEFADIITTHVMNSSSTNVGGWPASELYSLINSESNSSSIINALPSDLKSVITDTYTVSGHGSTSGEENFASTDKLYLLSTVEVWSKDTSTGLTSISETATDVTRQLDYYSLKGVIPSVTASDDVTPCIKYYNSEATGWWSRSARSERDYTFYVVWSDGTAGGWASTLQAGVSPAFRLAGPDTSPTGSFSTDSWETIAANVKGGNTSNYNVGDTKTVDLGDTYGTHTVRIANMSTPDECATDGFSQTACGFVVEFADVITTYAMNASKTNTGGWSSSRMRTFLNSESTTTSIYNSLPSSLKTAITNTYTVSGYGSNDSAIITSTDKIYLLATAEIWAQGSSNTINYDNARDYTRQLDYYSGVTTNSYAKAIKNNSDGTATLWWLRSAVSIDTSYFYLVYGSGVWSDYSAEYDRGVSPAFRIG